MKNSVLLLLIFLTAFGCKEKSKNTDPDPEIAPTSRIVPTDVIVKTKKDFTMDKVFDLINQYDHPVEYIYGTIYTSSLPPDRLQYVLDYINTKSYARRPDWPASGYRHYLTDVIHVFPRLFDMHVKEHQRDWLDLIKTLRMTEVTDRENFTGTVIFMHVPEGTEEQWVERFRKMPFVDWAQTNHYADIEPL